MESKGIIALTVAGMFFLFAFVGLQAGYINNLVVLRDGTNTLTGVWDAGDFNITASWFEGSFNSSKSYWGIYNRTDTLAYPEQPVSYIVFNSSNVVWAKNASSGQIDYGGTWDAGGIDGADASAVIESVIGNSDTNCVLLKDGEYSTDSIIIISGKTDFTFKGESWGAVIKPSGDNTAIRIGTSPADAKRITIKDLKIDGSNQATAVNTPPIEGEEIKLGIHIYTDCEAIIENVYLYSTGSDSVYGQSPGFTIVRDNLIEENRGWYGAIHTHGKNYNFYVVNNIIKNSVGGIRHGNVIVGNRILNITGNMPAIFGSDMGSIIAGNHLEDITWNGIEIFADRTVATGNFIDGISTNGRFGVETASYSHLSVTSNSIFGFERGINMGSGGSYNSIDFNTIKNCTDGIYVHNEKSIISYNTIYNVSSRFFFIQNKNDNTISFNIMDVATKEGIYLRGNRTRITGNQIGNVNQANSTWSSIKLDYYSVNNTVSDNSFLTDIVNIQPNNLIVLWGDGNYIHGNDFRSGDASSTMINDFATNTVIFANAGYEVNELVGYLDMNHNYILNFDMSHWLNFEVAEGAADETLNIVPAAVLLQDRHYHRLTLGVDMAPGAGKFFNMTLTDGTNELMVSLTGAETSAWTITGEFDWDASAETLTLKYSQTAGGAVNNAFVTIKYHYEENE